MSLLPGNVFFHTELFFQMRALVDRTAFFLLYFIVRVVYNPEAEARGGRVYSKKHPVKEETGATKHLFLSIFCPSSAFLKD